MNVRIFWVRAMKCMCAQTRPRFILSSKAVFGGMEFELMLTPREKSPVPENVPRGGSNPRHCGQRAQALPTELFRPPNIISKLIYCHHHESVLGVKCQSFLFVSWPLFECQARLLIFLVGRSSECSITLPARPPSSKSNWRFMSQQHVQSVSGTETAQTVIPSRAATLRNKLQIQLAVFPSQSTLTPRQSVPSLAPLRDVFGRAAAITVPCVQSPVWLGWGCFLFFCCCFFLSFFVFCVPQLYLWGSPLLGEIFAYVPVFFNPSIKVVTFRLRGWCVLGVFLLPAFTRLGHERQDLLSPCDEMHVCTD